MITKNAFSKVTSFSEKEKIFNQLIVERGFLLCKAEKGRLFKLYPEDFVELNLVCSDTEAITKYVGAAIVNFKLGNDRYYMNTTLTYKKGKYYISTERELFMLQRRQNFRVNVPMGFFAKLNITDINGDIHTVSADIHDISAGGARLRLPDNLKVFKQGDVLKGSLILGKRVPIEVSGMVRHTHKIKFSGQMYQVLGIQFHPASKQDESRYLAVVMDLLREFLSVFQKYSR